MNAHDPGARASLAADEPLTAEEFAALPETQTAELIDGRVAPMTPTGERHGAIEVRLGGLLESFVRERGLGRVSVGEVGLITQRGPDRVRGADIVFRARSRGSAEAATPGFLEVAPDLVVEILSPEDRPGELAEKVDEYRGMGVPEVWLVRPDERCVDVIGDRGVVRVGGDDNLTGGGPLAGFAVPVSDIFDV